MERQNRVMRMASRRTWRVSRAGTQWGDWSQGGGGDSEDTYDCHTCTKYRQASKVRYLEIDH